MVTHVNYFTEFRTGIVWLTLHSVYRSWLYKQLKPCAILILVQHHSSL